jgi:LPXTG-motif cell wall-anchored protein
MSFAIAPPRIRAAVVTVAALVVALTVGAVPTPAQAATQLLISPDGIAWGATLPAGLFDDIGIMVPMDSETATFYVKNPTADPATLRVSVQDLVVTSSVLASSMTLTAWDDGSGLTTSESLGSVARCDIVVPAQTIGANAVVRIDLTITMLDVSGLTAQGQVGSLTFLAAMRDLAAGPFPASACDDGGVLIPTDLPTRMPTTGSDLPSDWLVVGGALLGLGLLLVISRRRRRDEELAE